MAKRAFVKPDLIDEYKAGEILILDETTAHRFVRVLRLESGANVELLDGRGRLLKGVLGISHPVCLREVQIEVVLPPKSKVILAQALIKMDKLEQAVQRSTELGVDEIIFFDSERSQVRFKEKSEQKIDRLGRIAADAARQSERALVPELKGPFSFQQLIKFVHVFSGLKVLGDLDAQQNLAALLEIKKDLVREEGILVVVGPEGGLSLGEITKLEKGGGQSVKWNPNVLRAETAGMTFVAIVKGTILQ